MNVKQIVAKLISKENGILAAICFILTSVSIFTIKYIPPSYLRLNLLILAILITLGAFWTTRLIYLNEIITNNPKNLKLLPKIGGFQLSCIIGILIIVLLEFITCGLFKIPMKIFAIIGIFTITAFIMIFFSYIGVTEYKYFKNNGLSFKELFQFEKLNQEFSANTLSHITIISLVQTLLPIALIYFTLSSSAIPVKLILSSIGSYAIGILIFSLEDLKLYYISRYSSVGRVTDS